MALAGGFLLRPVSILGSDNPVLLLKQSGSRKARELV